MAPRGEVAMIVALIGLNQGTLTQELYVSLVNNVQFEQGIANSPITSPIFFRL